MRLTVCVYKIRYLYQLKYVSMWLPFADLLLYKSRYLYQLMYMYNCICMWLPFAALLADVKPLLFSNSNI